MGDLRARLQTALGAAYRVEKELGGGGMSRVFLATEAALHRQVVIKVLPPELVSHMREARFRQEIDLAAHLQHTNILNPRRRVPVSSEAPYDRSDEWWSEGRGV